MKKDSKRYSGGTGKSGDGKATYVGPQWMVSNRGSWRGPAGNPVKGPQRKLGDLASRYYYSKGEVKKKY